MSLKELCEKYNLSESSVTSKFNRTKESILKRYGINIIKIGRGAAAQYLESVNDSQRAVTLYEEPENNLFYVDEDIIGLETWEFMILVALLVKPELVFRGTYQMLVEYLGKKITSAHINAAQSAIYNLVQKGHILFIEDEEDYFIIGLKRQTEKKIVDLQLNIVKRCHNITIENHKRDWVPLTKVIAAAIYFKGHEPVTTEQIKKLTGLSEASIRDSKKLLKKNNLVIYKKEHISDGNFINCTGSSADVNAFLFQ